MDGVEDILNYAWSKNSESLKSAVDTVMSARASEVIANMTADVSASMFGNTIGDEGNNEEIVQDDASPTTTEEIPSTAEINEPELEGTSDV